MKTTHTPYLSIVVPMYNESEGIKAFHYDLLLPEVTKAVKNSYEIIYINDGSRDNTLELLTDVAKKNKRVKVVALARNFGKEIATTAGIQVANGEITIVMDGDGQHPPVLIPDFIRKYKSGAQVVVGVRKEQQHEGLIKKLGSYMFYKAFNSTSGVAITPRSTDYRLITREVREEFNKFTERNRITRGLIDWLGFEREYIYFDSPARIAGRASYRTVDLFRLATNSFISLSLKPLFVFGWVGMIIILLSVLLGLFILIEQFLLGDPLQINFSGPFILGVFTSLLVGLVLVSQAILAAYISHIHTQSQGRPTYVINKRDSKNL